MSRYHASCGWLPPARTRERGARTMALRWWRPGCRARPGPSRSPVRRQTGSRGGRAPARRACPALRTTWSPPGSRRKHADLEVDPSGSAPTGSSRRPSAGPPCFAQPGSAGSSPRRVPAPLPVAAPGALHDNARASPEGPAGAAGSGPSRPRPQSGRCGRRTDRAAFRLRRDERAAAGGPGDPAERRDQGTGRGPEPARAVLARGARFVGLDRQVDTYLRYREGKEGERVTCPAALNTRSRP